MRRSASLLLSPSSVDGIIFSYALPVFEPPHVAHGSQLNVLSCLIQCIRNVLGDTV